MAMQSLPFASSTSARAPFPLAFISMVEPVSSDSGDSERDYSTAATSNDASAPPSPAPSMYSITPSIIEESFRTLHGRRINNHSDIYQLPADEEEMARLDAMEPIQAKLLTSQYANIPKCLLDDNREVTKACLDLGCGSGKWAQQIAERYPHVAVCGVDLVPVQTPGPPNLRFEVDDINLGLEHFYSCFDLVHARRMSSGIKDYYGLVDQISRILRPQGMIMLSDWDWRVYDHQRNVIAPSPGDSTRQPFPRWVRAVSLVMRRLGSNLDAAPLFGVWLRQHHNFKNVDSSDIWVTCGANVFEYWKTFFSACRPLLLAYEGMSADSVATLETAALQELRSNPRMQVRFFYATATRA